MIAFNRYLLFVFDPKSKTPKGGFHAFKKDFETLKAAQLYTKNKNFRFHQIVDIEEGRIVEEQE